MGDFLLDLRFRSRRSSSVAAEQLRFAPDTEVHVYTEPGFDLVVTHTGNPSLWAPFQSAEGCLVAVAGRAAFDDDQWQAAAEVPGEGGLAAKGVYQRYRALGSAGLETISGNCAVLLHDPARRELHLVTDCSGAFPTFRCETPDGPVYGSHPDVLADACGEGNRLDEVSMAEFLLSGTVSPPYTYYERIRAVDHAAHITLALGPDGGSQPWEYRYFAFAYRGDPAQSEQELAEELAGALRRSVRRRTLPRLGPSAIALSGGLDSRALLACVEDKDRVFAFCCYDEPNLEFRTAERIAQALDIRFVPIKRSGEYYGDHAEEGVRISGGMGSFANNHFLGAMERLRAEGMQNLLTGCYCDYLFKGLPLNRRTHRLTGREELAPFSHQFYFDHFNADTPLAARVRERWEARIPTEFRNQATPAAVLEVEARRTFPLCYEGDNQQRVVPQRVTGWCLPVADREILELYCRIPYQYKLNRSIFLKTLKALSTDRLARIPDTNTGARPGAGRIVEFLCTNGLRIRRKLRRLRPSAGSDESWPNWQYYVGHSRTLKTLWQRPNPEAMDFFRRVLGPENVADEIEAYHGNRVFRLVSMLTLKLWLDQRR